MKYLFFIFLFSIPALAETCYKYDNGDYTPRHMKQCRGKWKGNQKLALEYAIETCNSTPKKIWNKTLSKCINKKPKKVSCYQILDNEIFNKKLEKCAGDWFSSKNAAIYAFKQGCEDKGQAFDREELECYKAKKKRRKKLSKACKKIRSLKSKTQNESLITEIDEILSDGSCADDYESILSKVKNDYKKTKCESQGKIWSEINEGIFHCLVKDD